MLRSWQGRLWKRQALRSEESRSSQDTRLWGRGVAWSGPAHWSWGWGLGVAQCRHWIFFLVELSFPLTCLVQRLLNLEAVSGLPLSIPPKAPCPSASGPEHTACGGQPMLVSGSLPTGFFRKGEEQALSIRTLPSLPP